MQTRHPSPRSTRGAFPLFWTSPLEIARAQRRASRYLRAMHVSAATARAWRQPTGPVMSASVGSTTMAILTSLVVAKVRIHDTDMLVLPNSTNANADINECALRERYPELRDQYPCSSGGICKNRLGGYDCPCKTAMQGDGKTGTYTEKFPLPAKLATGKTGIQHTFICEPVCFL